MSSSHLALLRGINVGGKNRVPMKELADVFRSVGCEGVRTFIQSGNVLFDGSYELISGLGDVLTRSILDAFGCSVPLVFRTVGELEAVVAENPFLAAGEPEANQYVAFLRDQPSPERVSSLEPDRSPPDSFAVIGREIYMNLPGGVGNTKLTNAYFDSKLKTVSTGRNWRTVTALLQMMRE